MEHIKRILVEPLTPEAFAPYGRVVERPMMPYEFEGEGWGCWFPIQRMDGIKSLGVGITHSFRSGSRLLVTKMERHPDNEELLIAVQGHIIQPMGVPENLDDEDALPDPDKVRAFLISPGQAIIMKKGAWHSAALPVGSDTLYCFAADSSGSYPWVDFPNKTTILLEL